MHFNLSLEKVPNTLTALVPTDIQARVARQDVN